MRGVKMKNRSPQKWLLRLQRVDNIGTRFDSLFKFFENGSIHQKTSYVRENGFVWNGMWAKWKKTNPENLVVVRDMLMSKYNAEIVAGDL